MIIIEHSYVTIIAIILGRLLSPLLSFIQTIIIRVLQFILLLLLYHCYIIYSLLRRRTRWRRTVKCRKYEFVSHSLQRFSLSTPHYRVRGQTWGASASNLLHTCFGRNEFENNKKWICAGSCT